jgi:hypothetical protein
MKQYDGGDWAGLITDYKQDVMFTHKIVWNNNRSPGEKEEAHVRKAADFLSRFQCSQARRHLQSYGLGNHTDTAIADQMTWKHPVHKAPVTALSNDEMQFPRKGIDHDLFLWEIRTLKVDVAPGLGCLRNEHLLALAVNQSCQIMPSAAAAIDSYLDYANAFVQVQMLVYFYPAWVSSRLVPANKVHPDDLPPGTTPDCCPVNIGSAERRLITRVFFDDDLKAIFNKIVGPVQNGVGTQAGISITAFGVTATVDAVPEFGVIQGDPKNGYIEVSHKSIICALQEAVLSRLLALRNTAWKKSTRVEADYQKVMKSEL